MLVKIPTIPTIKWGTLWGTYTEKGHLIAQVSPSVKINHSPKAHIEYMQIKVSTSNKKKRPFLTSPFFREVERKTHTLFFNFFSLLHGVF